MTSMLTKFVNALIVVFETCLPLQFAYADVPVVPVGQEFRCTPVQVWDGDGPIWCAEGPRVRLSGIAAREIDGSCRSNHPCPSSSGVDARNALVAMIGKPIGVGQHGHINVSAQALNCRSEGSAGGTRTAAWCISPTFGDLSCAMVRDGWALRWNRYWNGHTC